MLCASDIDIIKMGPPLETINTYRFLKISNHTPAFQFPAWEEIFGNKLPVNIEYCSGNGHWIVEKAKEEKLKNWVAVEWKFERAKKIFDKRSHEGLTNLLIICAEAVAFTKQHLMSQSVAKVFIHFPDPWPKRRHAKNRILQSPFLEQLARILIPEGSLTVVTDYPPLMEQTLRCLSHMPIWKAVFPEPYYVIPSSYGYSVFARLWQSKGLSLLMTEFVRQEERPRILPSGGSVRSVVLDCGIRSNLKWSIEKGVPALWELQTEALEDEGAIRAFELAIDHVVDTVIAHHPTFGVLLYKGKGPAPITLLRSLAARLPDEVTPYIALDLSEYDHSDFFHALKREELVHFGLIIKGGRWPYAIKAIGWDQPSPYGVYGQGEILPMKNISFALCYSEDATFEVPQELCRIIPESLLTDEWEGVDRVLAIAPTAMGKRKLAGFEAAGGTVLNNLSFHFEPGQKIL